MRGAPVLNGVAGSLIGLLDAFLIDGWGMATANSLSVSGGVATLTMPAGSDFEDGCVVLIAGATPAALNGEQRIATTNGTTLTFPTTAADGPATGTITVKYAPCGWQKAFSGANLAVYRSQNVMGNRRFLRVQDTGNVDARVVAYNNMTGVSTGTGPFPTAAQISGGGYWLKSTSANATAQRYDCLGDDRMFYFGLCRNYMSSGGAAEGDKYTYSRLLAFGDPIYFKTSGDAWGTFLSASNAANDAASVNGVVDAGRVNGHFVERSPAGTGGPVETYSIPEAGSANAWSGEDSDGFGPFPNAIDGRLRLCRRFVCASQADLSPRAALPGLLSAPVSGLTSHPTFKARDTLDGSGALAGRKLMLLWIGSYAKSGGSFFDITGPWR